MSKSLVVAYSKKLFTSWSPENGYNGMYLRSIKRLAEYKYEKFEFLPLAELLYDIGYIFPNNDFDLLLNDGEPLGWYKQDLPDDWFEIIPIYVKEYTRKTKTGKEVKVKAYEKNTYILIFNTL